MTPAEVADLLEYSGGAYLGALRSVPPEAASWHPAEGEWCVNECVGHVIEAEKLAFAGRIRTILAADNPTFQTWNQATVAESRHDCERSPQDMLEQFEPLRRDSLGLIRSLRAEDLTRAGTHPKVGRLTVGDLLHEWVHHDGNHLRQALANVQAYVFPKMGNAQRF
jgi:hypothetical protein